MIVLGKDDAVQTVQGIDVGRAGKIHHVAEVYACVDGEIVQVVDVLDEIDHFEISLEYVYVYTMTSKSDGGYDYLVLGRDLAAVNEVGSITVTENSVQVNVTTSLRCIDLNCYIYAVYRDGHKTKIHNVTNFEMFKFNVGYYVYFSGNGGYVNEFLGTQVKEGHVSGSSSGTVDISTDASSSAYTAFLSTERRASGTTRNRQTFNSCTAGGKTIPIVVVDRLS